MLCSLISLDLKQAKNSNFYVDIVAQAANDPWSESLKYRMWVSKELGEKLRDNTPATIELEKVRVEVEAYLRKQPNGTVSPTVYNHLSVVVRQLNGVTVDDVEYLAKRMRANMIKEGSIVEAVNPEEDPFAGGSGDAPF